MGWKPKSFIKGTVGKLGSAVENLSKGDLKGTVVDFNKAIGNLYSGGALEASEEKKRQLAKLTEEEKAAQATLAPVDPNAEMARQMEEERKRRLRTPGRAQYMLTSSNNLPSLIGDNSALGKNGLY